MPQNLEINFVYTPHEIGCTYESIITLFVFLCSYGEKHALIMLEGYDSGIWIKPIPGRIGSLQLLHHPFIGSWLWCGWISSTSPREFFAMRNQDKKTSVFKLRKLSYEGY